MRALIFQASFALLSCAPSAPVEAPVVEVPPVIVDKAIHGDTRFSPFERVIVEDKCGELYRVSSGRIRLVMVWDFDARTFMSLANEPHMLRSPAEYAPGTIAGKVTDNVLRVVADKCPDLGACALHELGHFAGLPHVDLDGAAMSERNPASYMTPADVASCTRIGLCGVHTRSRTTTTVTVTVDPSIPRIEPDYPVSSH